MTYCQLGPQEQAWLKFLDTNVFIQIPAIKSGNFCSGRSVLKPPQLGGLFWGVVSLCKFLPLIVLQPSECENAYFKMDNVLIDDRRIHVDFSQSVAKLKWQGKGSLNCVILMN